jgi:putative membrane protein
LTDLVLAIAHHLLVFAIAAVLAAEAVLVWSTLVPGTLRTLGRLDAAYGLLAGAILVVGFLRVFYGLKGPEAFLPNPYFWAKLGAFAAVGLLSVQPTLRILNWRRRLNADAAFLPPAHEVRTVRGFFLAEGLVFALIPVFAAMMARGYGLG